MRSYSLTQTTLVSLCIAVLTLLSGCGGGSNPQLSVTQLAAQLRTTPERVTVGNGQTLQLTPYIWRDFQPVSPVNGKPMIAIFRIAATDQSPLPNELRVERAWVISDNDVWATQPAEEQPRDPRTLIQSVSQNGPKWEPGTLVDVIVEIRDSQNTVHRLQTRQQTVQRTD